MRGLYILTALALLNVCQGQTTYGDPALAGRCPANTEDTLATLLSVVQTQRNAQAALTTRVRQKMVELGLASPVPASTTTGGGRRLAATESVSLHLSSEYVAELGSGDNWEDFRLSKNEIASDPEAAALAAYFKQTTAEQLGIQPADVTVVTMSTDPRRTENPDGETTQELVIHYQTTDTMQ